MRRTTGQEWIVIGLTIGTLLGIALLGCVLHLRSEDRYMAAAAYQDLRTLQGFFATHSTGETYPNSDTAQALWGKASESSCRSRGLIDHFYYTTKPVPRDSSAVLLVVQVGQRHYGITGNGEFTVLTQNSLGTLNLVRLVEPNQDRRRE